MSDQHVLEYLHQLFPSDIALPENNVTVTNFEPVNYITSKLTRKKFRKRAVTAESLNKITGKVELSIQENKPIHFVIPFGGYKHFWNSSHPEPDWAELFHFRYLVDFVAPVLSVHAPGVFIEYMSEDLILPRMDNYPPEAIERYIEVFAEILSWFNERTPSNLKFGFFRVGDRVNKENLIADVEALLPERRKAFDQLTQDEKKSELHRSVRSVYWNGWKDLTQLTETEKFEKTIESRLIELAYYDTEAQPEYMGDYLDGDNRICLLFSFGTTHDNDSYQDLTIGSSYGSVVDHWVGRGVLIQRGERLMPRIVSHEQYNNILSNLETIAVTNFPKYKNYKQVEILNEAI